MPLYERFRKLEECIRLFSCRVFISLTESLKHIIQALPPLRKNLRHRYSTFNFTEHSVGRYAK